MIQTPAGGCVLGPSTVWPGSGNQSRTSERHGVQGSSRPPPPLGGAWGLPWLVCAMAVYVYGLGGGHMFEHNAPPPLGGRRNGGLCAKRRSTDYYFFLFLVYLFLFFLLSILIWEESRLEI